MESRFRQTTIIVGSHMIPLTHLEVSVLVRALDEHRRALKARLAVEGLPDGVCRDLAIEANIASKLTDLPRTGNAPRDQSDLAQWRADVAVSVKRELGLARRRSSRTAIEVAPPPAELPDQAPDEREPWEQFADEKRATGDSPEGSR